MRPGARIAVGVLERPGNGETRAVRRVRTVSLLSGFAYPVRMAVTPARIDVGPSSPQRLDLDETITRLSVLVTNRGTGSVFLGGPTVTASGPGVGYELMPGESASVDLRRDDKGLFGISGSGTQRVDRLQVGWSQ